MAAANAGEYIFPSEKGQWDAQSQNDIDRNARQFRDLDLYFGRTSGTKDISVVTDIQAIKRSIRQLVLLNQYEKPFHPEIYGGVVSSLFEPMDPLTASVIATQIEEVVHQNEPRVNLINVRAQEDWERNSYEITVEFFVRNAPTELVDLTFMLERLR